jgi:hypothetical protein
MSKGVLRRTPSGWISHYAGVTPAELRARGGLPNAINAAWLDRFSLFVRSEVPRGGLVRQRGSSTVPASIQTLWLMPGERRRLVDAHREARLGGGFLDVALGP